MVDPKDSREKRLAYKREWKRVWRANAANRAKKNAELRAWRAANPEKAREASRKQHAKERENPQRLAYGIHKRGARKRNIPFLLTFEEWMGIWLESGCWPQRGTRNGQYVMARFGDIGPYAIGNVRICTSGENNSEGHRGKQVTDASRKRMSESAKARHISVSRPGVVPV